MDSINSVRQLLIGEIATFSVGLYFRTLLQLLTPAIRKPNSELWFSWMRCSQIDAAKVSDAIRAGQNAVLDERPRHQPYGADGFGKYAVNGLLMAPGANRVKVFRPLHRNDEKWV